jgi:hypothetical protein
LLPVSNLGLLALSLAALLLAAGPTRRWERVLIALLTSVGVLFIVSLAQDPIDAAVGTYSLIVAAAFAGGALVAPGGPMRQALRAMLWGIAGTGALGMLVRGPGFWSELHWSAVRQATTLVGSVIERRPEIAPVFTPFVQFLGDGFPGLLVLGSLAGLALAWQWHVRIAARPLGPPLSAFREFRFGDQWVWGLVSALLIWAVPRLAGLKWAAMNLGLVLGVLYLLRGTAVVVALAATVGVPTWILAAGAIAAGVLIVPLLVIVPGLWTLGVFDTWLAFRQRRLNRFTAS